MIWLTEQDFKKQIRNSVLVQVIEQDASLLAEAELATLEEIESYLRSRFDVLQIWNKQGKDRNQLLVMQAVDILLYHLHSRIPSSQIPDLRIKRYDNAIDWLKAVAKGTLSPNLPLIASESEPSAKFTIGSEPRRRN
jgi:phage gp36-like protein